MTTSSLEALNATSDSAKSGRVHHLYVHIPFCTHICPYCAFYKTRNLTPAIQQFLEAFPLEWRQQQTRFQTDIKTIFLGGGTPSALSQKHSVRFFESLSEGLSSEVEEFTLEANPESVTPDKAALWKEHGVTRISLGVQSFDPKMLTLLGRTHDPSRVERAVDIVRDAEFDLSIDLMFALPGQSDHSWVQTLETAMSLEPDHLSAYNLNYEEDTEFLKKLEAGEFRINASQECQHFELGCKLLAQNGFEHYEISNFARKGYRCQHNEAYWFGADYLGLGPSAVSTVQRKRWKNHSSTELYAKALLAGNDPSEENEFLDDEAWRMERLALELRTDRGIKLSLLDGKEKELDQLREEGLIDILLDASDRTKDVILTSRGKLVADSISDLLL